MAATIYPFAVIDGNQEPSYSLRPSSCHRTLAAAQRVVAKAWRDPNSHHYVVTWDASPRARLRPAPEHYVDAALQPRDHRVAWESIQADQENEALADAVNRSWGAA